MPFDGDCNFPSLEPEGSVVDVYVELFPLVVSAALGVTM
jgi:hypothetical protein